jgi:hypothetical protein
MNLIRNQEQGLIGIIIVLIIVGLLSGGLYYYLQRQSAKTTEVEKPIEEEIVKSEEPTQEEKEGEITTEEELSCQNDCSQADAKRCSGSGYQACGNYDDDECLEWSSITSCSTNTVCQNGICIQQKCSDGTLYSQCSTTKPLYCGNGQLINSCDKCGCSSGKNCQVGGSCVSSNCKIIKYSGNPEDKLDIIFVPDESYEDMSKFLSDAKKHIDEAGVNNGLLAFEPFKSNQNKINFYWLDKKFNTNELDTKLINIYLTPKTGEPDPVRSLCPEAEQIIIIKNSAEWAGWARVFSGLTITTNNPLLTVHEFAHAFGDLQDEYFGDPHPESNDIFPYSVSSFEKKINVNCFPAPSKEYCLENAPWKDIIDNLIVSCFEGCNYFIHGIYRPTESSIMSLKTAFGAGGTSEINLSFGPVNERELLKELNEYK